MKRIALAVLALAACKDTEIVIGGLQEVTSLRSLPNRDLDILFVIDNSPSMADDQAALAANFPVMMDVLSELDGDLPNLHIGITTSDMGTSGGPPIGSGGQGGCAGTGDNGALAGFLTDVVDPSTGERVRNYSGTLRDAFTAEALVGQGGCGFEQHLGAMQAALATGANPGFLRPEANLAVVFLADEDDCTATAELFAPESAALGPLQSYRCFEFGVTCTPDTPRDPGVKTACAPRASPYTSDVQPYIDALVATKSDERMLMVAAIAGPAEPVEVVVRPPPGGGAAQLALSPSCAYEGATGLQTADPAVRLSAFVNAFAPRSTFTPLCSNDLSAPLVQIGATAKKLIGDPCIDTTSLQDLDPSTDGVQPACEVLDIRDDAPFSPVSLPACGGGAANCYRLAVDTQACPRTPGSLKLTVERSTQVGPDTWTHVRCQQAD